MNEKKLLVLAIIGILVLGAITYAGYQYTQKKTGSITLPGGSTYLGPTTTSTEKQQPQVQQQYPSVPLFKVDPEIAWIPYIGKIYPYTFSYPSTLPIIVYNNDPNDTVSISWANIPPQQNVLLNIETVAKLDPKYVKGSKEAYVQNWWKQFNGLKGVKSVVPFTNAQGLKGFRLRYLDFSDNAPVDNVFFEAAKDQQYMIHLANGVLSPEVFERIVHSVNWISPTPTP